MRRMGATAPDAAKLQATDAAYAGEERDFVTHIAGFVQSQVSKLVAMAAPMLEVAHRESNPHPKRAKTRAHRLA
jgi:hypothetical protein